METAIEHRYAIVDDRECIYIWTLNSNRQYVIRDFVSSSYGSTKWMQIDGTFETAWKAAKKEGYRTEKITMTWNRSNP